MEVQRETAPRWDGIRILDDIHIVEDARVETTPSPVEPAEPIDIVSGWPKRKLYAAVAAVYAAGFLLVNTSTHLLTDVGGKTASMAAMINGGDWDPGLDYWFESSDPEGRFFPAAHTSLAPNGSWINSTSWTMLLVARPLWAIGGARLALIIPLLGSLAAAFAGRSLYRRLYPNHNADTVFALVALGTPILIYAFDFWEHGWGAALTVAGMTKTLDAIERRSRAATIAAMLAGLSYGVAATMRQEALVFGFVAGVALLTASLRTRGVIEVLRGSAIFAVGAIAPVVAHGFVEHILIGGPSRVSRGSETLQGIPTDALFNRAAAGATMLGFAFERTIEVGWVVSATMVLLLGMSAISFWVWGPRSGRLVAALFAITISLYVASVLVYGGHGRVPGLFIATPLAAFGAAAVLRRRNYAEIVVLAGAVPLVLATGFTAGSLSQWGGRYLLGFGIAMVVAGYGWVRENSTFITALLVGCSLTISLLGAGFSVHTSQVRAMGLITLLDVSDEADAVIWEDWFLSREFGPEMITRQWLSARSEEDRRDLAPRLTQAGIDEFFFVAVDSENVNFDGFEEVGSRHAISSLGATLMHFSANGS